jgi:hypothetical protein
MKCDMQFSCWIIDYKGPSFEKPPLDDFACHFPPKAGAWLSIPAPSAGIDKSNQTLCALCASSERSERAVNAFAFSASNGR